MLQILISLLFFLCVCVILLPFLFCYHKIQIRRGCVEWTQHSLVVVIVEAFAF